MTCFSISCLKHNHRLLLSSSQRSQRPGKDQTLYLVSYMEEHTFMSRCQIKKLGATGVDTWRRLWELLAEDFNGLGPAQKSTEEWMQVM